MSHAQEASQQYINDFDYNMDVAITHFDSYYQEIAAIDAEKAAKILTLCLLCREFRSIAATVK